MLILVSVCWLAREFRQVWLLEKIYQKMCNLSGSGDKWRVFREDKRSRSGFLITFYEDFAEEMQIVGSYALGTYQLWMMNLPVYLITSG